MCFKLLIAGEALLILGPFEMVDKHKRTDQKGDLYTTYALRLEDQNSTHSVVSWSRTIGRDIRWSYRAIRPTITNISLNKCIRA